MNLRILLFSIFTLASTIAQAGVVDRGFRALEKGQYQKASDFFYDHLKEVKVSAAANYGLAKVYYSADFKKYNLEQAYFYATNAAEDHAKNNTNDFKELADQDIKWNDISNLINDIESDLLNGAISNNTVAAMNEYINAFPSAMNLDEAVHMRDALAFADIQGDSSVATYDAYLRKYPQSHLVNEVRTIRDAVAFKKAQEKGTVEAFAEFVDKYPDAAQFEAAKSSRDNLAYINLLEKNKRLDELEFKQKQAQSELEKEKVEKESARQKQNNTMLIIAMVITILLVFVTLFAYRQSRKKNVEINKQKDTIQEKNLQILDSIKYAKFIQEAILPAEEEIFARFPESFILFKPRDLVSGDFYWVAETADHYFVAAVDCTGHGVPGAFMSMIGHTLLNQVVLIEQLDNPADILFRLREEVMRALKQRGRDDDAKDGMDMALCSISKDRKTLQFAGAFNPLYIVQNGELNQVKGDRQPVASYYNKNDKTFTNHTFELNKGDVFYIFSDGYADQFGGSRGKKFSYRKLRNIIAENHDKSVKYQKQLFEDEMSNWKRGYDQVDDILIICVKI